MIYLLSSDGHRDSIILDHYFESKLQIAVYLDKYLADMFGHTTRNIVVSFKANTVSYEYQPTWETDPDEWDPEVYHLIPIAPVE